jgi:hypothetical protein
MTTAAATVQRISEPFYALTETISEMLRKIHLTAAEWRLWSYLSTLDQYGDRLRDLPPLPVVLSRCQIGKSTFYAAIAKFQKHGIFDFQPTGFKFRNRQGVKSQFFSEGEIVRDFGQQSENSESESEISETSLYKEVSNSLSEGEGEVDEKINQSGDPETPPASLEVQPKISETKKHSKQDLSSAAAPPVEKVAPEVAEMLSNRCYVMWLANRSNKTKWGAEERFLTGEAFAKAWIRKNPESATDMFDSFVEEMTHRVEVLNQRLLGGQRVTPNELEEIAAIVPYSAVDLVAAPRQLPASSPSPVPPPPPTAAAPPPPPTAAAPPPPQIAAAPSGENAEAYKPFQPSGPEPDPNFWQKLAQRLSLTKQQKQSPEPTDQFEKYRSWLRGDSPPLRAEAISWVERRDKKYGDIHVLRDDTGQPYDFHKCEPF